MKINSAFATTGTQNAMQINRFLMDHPPYEKSPNDRKSRTTSQRVQRRDPAAAVPPAKEK
jgi:hypothetical protein